MHHREIAAITGASSGIGAVYADRLARRGYDLLLIARRADRLESLAEQLRSRYGVEVQLEVADLTDSRDLQRVNDRLVSEPRLTMLVNNAGTASMAPIGQTPAQEIQAMIALNVVALTQLASSLLPVFLERDRGTLIQVGSVLSLHSFAFGGVYSGTKGYVANFTRGLQMQAAGSQVRIQAVLPPATATEIWNGTGITDTERMMNADDMVDAALAGLDQGEGFTLPALADAGLWEDFEKARARVFEASLGAQKAQRLTGAPVA